MRRADTKGLTAWERWELASFDETEKATPQAPPAPQLPTAAELEEIRSAAHAAGFAEGREEGLAAGRQAGHAEGYAAGYAAGRAAAEEAAARLVRLAEALDAALGRLEEETGREILALAVELSRLIVRSQISHRPETLQAVIHEALAQLPQQHATIRISPQDAALVRSLLGDALGHGGHRLVEDERLSRGDCVLEAGHTQLDARLSVRWRRALEQLGAASLLDADFAPHGDET
ncbi:MAG: FliH/SctL family protein [Rhodocyclaceae bacterium]|nr:FliH/SctL family protein [Rhodocyclaceae bacterium]